MRVIFCGVRGSTPAPGFEFVRYGGHTSCVALAHEGQPPSFVLDGGTGLRQLSTLLGDQPFVGTVLLSHLHWDHTQGLPFFAVADRGTVDLLLPEQGNAADVLGRAMGPPHFPLRPTELRGSWRFHGLDAGSHSVSGWSVVALDVPHGGGRTFGYRVSDGTATIAYISDHRPTDLGPGPDGLGEYHEAAVELAQGADLLIHDAQLLASELDERDYLGHAAAEYAVRLGEKAGAGAVALFHHDPDRTDDEIDALVARLGGGSVPVLATRQGLALDLAH